MNITVAKQRKQQVVMAHGGGGLLMQQLLRDHVLPRLANPLLDPLDDSAVLDRPDSRICFTTDAHVVQPVEFPGGDIGRLAVCGTVNDLAVMGARPIAMSLALILEEGLDIEVLSRITESVRYAADEAGVSIVTGDTKVIQNRGDGGIMITTSGIGLMTDNVNRDSTRIRPGDAVIVTGRLAEHGLAIMSARQNLAFDTKLVSDVRPLNHMIRHLLDTGCDVRFMRDPTRGGVAGVMNDLIEATGLSIELDESAVPLSGTARHTAEMLGLDPLEVPNEGACVIVVKADQARQAITALRSHQDGRDAAVVGKFTASQPTLVEMITNAGGRRIVSRPHGELLPRIC